MEEVTDEMIDDQFDTDEMDISAADDKDKPSGDVMNLEEDMDTGTEIEFFSTGFLNETNANYNTTELELMNFNSSLFFNDTEFNFFDEEPEDSINPMLLALPVVALVILGILLIVCMKRKSNSNSLEKVDPEIETER